MAAPRSVEDYLSQVPEEARAALEKLRKTIKEAAPNTTEMISYQMPTSKYQGQPLLTIASFKNHLQHLSLQHEGHGLAQRGTEAIRHVGEGTEHSFSGRQAPSRCARQGDREDADRGDRVS